MTRVQWCWYLVRTFAVLAPLLLLLGLSQAIWGDGRQCYQFWQEWSVSHQIVTRAARVVTGWGNALAYAIYGIILWRAILRRQQDEVCFVFRYILVQLVIALVLTHALKNAFGMPRPSAGEIASRPWSFNSLYQSFPSGHTVEIVGAALPLALRSSRMIIPALCGLWIASVAYSRVYLGRHFLMDIWGGLVLGTFAALLIHTFSRQQNRAA
jgi:undecaprenyl-diphosphatase